MPTTDSHRVFDPTEPGKYTVRLGQSLDGLKSSSNGFSSVTFNHKSRQTGSERATRIRPSQRANGPAYELSIEDEKGEEIIYEGRRRDLTNSYILTLDADGQTIALDTMPRAYEFNLVSTPNGKSEPEFAQKYKQINVSETLPTPVVGTTSGTEDEESGAESDGPDPNNPFDYRHYLNGIPTTNVESKQTSNVSTPLLGPKSWVVESPSQTNRAREAISRAPHPAPPRKPNAFSAPKVQFQQRKSKARQETAESEDDRGGLIIEDDPRPQPKKRRTAVPKRDKPTSTQAATREPKPAQSSQQTESPQQEAGSGYEEDDESDEPKGANDDIDDLQLPGPASDRPGLLRRQSTWEEGDAEALEAALEAFDEDDPPIEEVNEPSGPGDGSQNRAPQSESESEEE